MKNKSLFQLIKAIYCNYFFYIGNNKSCMNIIHVDDVVHALVMCAVIKKIPSRVYNLSSCCKIYSFVDIVNAAIGIKRKIIRVPCWLAYLFAYLGSFVFSNFPLTNTRVRALSSNVIYSSNLIEDELQFYEIVGNDKGLRELASYWVLDYNNTRVKK